MTVMEQNLSEIIECLSTIQGVKEIREYDGYIVFCYRRAYFLALFVDGHGKLERGIHITLNFDMGLDDNQMDLAHNSCLETMLEYESLRLFINDDAYNSICIHFMADYEDKLQAKTIKRNLNDSIEAHNFFINHFMMMDSSNLNF